MKQFSPLRLNSCEFVRRVLRHWFAFDWRAYGLLNPAERERIAQQIEASEQCHTAEIAVAIETRLPWRYLRRNARARERAWEAFGKMQVWDTPQNNGVLIYLLWADKRIEIVADRALAQVVPQAQWDEWIHLLHQHARARTWADGLGQVIAQLDEVLQQHFPQTAEYSDDNRSSNVPQML